MKLLQPSILYLAILSCFISLIAEAQIIPDDSLGNENSVVTPVETETATVDVINGGATRGASLFHSFQEFNINTGSGAFFSNPEGINNIFSRVTGTNLSNINGLLGVAGSANLFLINPNGIVFGQNAALGIQGSFVASTADSLLFDDNFEFSASNPLAPPLLEVNIPIGLSFRSEPENIINQSLGLSLPPNQTLALIGGDVNFDGGSVLSPGANIQLGGLRETGSVAIDSDFGFVFPDNVAKGDVAIANNSFAFVAGDDGGSVNIDSSNFSLTNGSSILAGIGVGIGSADARAGDIAINADGDVLINGGTNGLATTIENNIAGTGDAGNIAIAAENISLLNAGTINTNSNGQGDIGDISLSARGNILFDGVGTINRSGIQSVFNSLNSTGDIGTIDLTAQNLQIANGGQITSLVNGDTNGGNIKLTLDNSLSIEGAKNSFNSEISSQVFTGAGNAGNIEISTNSLSIGNNGTISTTGVSSTGDGGNITIEAIAFVEADNGRIKTGVLSDSEGNGGNLEINTARFSLNNGSEISADIDGVGNAGDITIEATNSIDLTESRILANISLGAEGNGGNLDITTARFMAGEGAFISADVFGIGNAGNITIEATDSLFLSETGFISAGIGLGGEGDSGNLAIDTNQLLTSQEALISASVEGVGNGGDIIINALDSVTLSDNSSIRSDILNTSTGNGGNIEILTKALNTNNTGRITAVSFGNGNAGDININAGNSIDLNGGSDTGRSGLFASALGSGNGGDLFITTDELNISNDATINVSNFQSRNLLEPGTGEAGTLEINADSLDLNNGALILAATESGMGGNITLGISDSITLRSNSNISAQAGTNANGGNLDIDTEFIIAFPGDSNISADAVEGQGGNINITAESLFGIAERSLNPFTNDINASSEFGLEGNIAINTPEVDPTSGLINLPTVVGDASNRISQNPCQQGVGSEFVITGKGGLPPNVNEALNSEATQVGLIEPLLTQIRGDGEMEKWKGSVTQESLPAQGWVFNEKGEVTLTAYKTNNGEHQRSSIALAHSCSPSIDK